jgi:uncharacterized protein YlxW (UPF0749 family)
MPETSDPHRDPDPTPEAAREATPEPAEDAPDSPRDRLVGSLRHPSRAQLVVGLLLAILGFAAVTQVQSNEQTNSYASLREQDLIEVLSGLTGAAERARGEIDRLESNRDALKSQTTSREAALDAAQERLGNLNILAGLVPVHGPGIRVTITESDRRVKVSSLLDLVQEARTAGAEAMEVNDRVRLIAQSSFDDSVGGIHLDGQEIASPYVFEIIGDPHTLHVGLSFASGPLEKLEVQDGADVEIEELEQIEIASTREVVRPGSATPDLGE